MSYLILLYCILGILGAAWEAFSENGDDSTVFGVIMGALLGVLGGAFWSGTLAGATALGGMLLGGVIGRANARVDDVGKRDTGYMTLGAFTGVLVGAFLFGSELSAAALGGALCAGATALGGMLLGRAIDNAGKRDTGYMTLGTFAGVLVGAFLFGSGPSAAPLGGALCGGLVGRMLSPFMLDIYKKHEKFFE